MASSASREFRHLPSRGASRARRCQEGGRFRAQSYSTYVEPEIGRPDAAAAAWGVPEQVKLARLEASRGGREAPSPGERRRSEGADGGGGGWRDGLRSLFGRGRGRGLARSRARAGELPSVSEAAPGTPAVLLAPLMPLPVDLSEHLPPLARGLRQDVLVQPLAIDLAAAYDPDRDQYLSSALLLRLLELRPAGAERLVGVVDVDLFVPVLTYVFGEAQLGGRVAIVSTFRLREPWLRGGAPAALLRERVGKTLLHELGHTHGLRHCPDPTCVMASASSLEMLDEKGPDLCLECRGTLAAPRPARP
jgi:archaemetzincin